MNDRVTELLQYELDGALDEAGRVELDRLLADSPQARRARDDLQRLAAYLESVPEADPPPGLRERILDSIVLPRSASWRRWFQGFALPVPLRYGLAGAAGVVLTLALVGQRHELQPTGDFSDLVGTVARGVPRPVDGVVDRFAFEQSGISAEASLARLDGNWVLWIDFETREPVDFMVDPGDGPLEITGVAGEHSGLRTAEMTAGALRGVVSGRENLALLLRATTAEAEGVQAQIELEFSREGSVIGTGQLDVEMP